MKKTLLFVSEDLRLLRTWKRWFGHDFEIFVKSGAFEALDCLKNNEVSIVLSEFVIHEMSGEEFLQLVAIQFPPVSRVLVTDAFEDERVKELYASGVIHQCCRRPWDKDKLTPVIYGLSRVVPSDFGSEYTQNNKNKDIFELNGELKGKLPAVMLLDQDQTNKNSIRLLCKGLKLRTYSISNFNYAKETTELRPEIGLVIMTINGHTNQALAVIERIKQRKKPIVIVCLLDDYTYGASAINFINNVNIFRCYTKPLPLSETANMIKDGLRQCIKLQRIEALLPDNSIQEEDGRFQKIKNIFRKTA